MLPYKILVGVNTHNNRLKLGSFLSIPKLSLLTVNGVRVNPPRLEEIGIDHISVSEDYGTLTNGPNGCEYSVAAATVILPGTSVGTVLTLS